MRSLLIQIILGVKFDIGISDSFRVPDRVDVELHFEFG